jgi:hypothetical protein
MDLIHQITVCIKYVQEIVALAMANVCRDVVYVVQALPVSIVP